MPHSDRFLQLKRLTLFRLFFISTLFLFIHRVLPLVERGIRPLPADPLHLFVAGLFLLSILYLVWLHTRWRLELLARVQCAVDPLLAFVLITLTGGVHSPLYFFFALSVLSTALILGRREALVVGVLAMLLTVLSNTLIGTLFSMAEPFNATMARWLVLQGTAFLLTALLAGTLSEKARGLQEAVEDHRENLASTIFLNRQIIDALPFGMITLTPQGVIRTVNTKAAEILDRAAQELTGRNLGRILPDFRWVLDNPVQETIHVEMNHHQRILDVSLSPLVDFRDTHVGVLVVLRDLSHQKKLEKELAEKDRLALAGRMAAFMAHEIRNPLASIMSAVQMLGTSEGENRRERLRRIVLEEVTRINRLTTDFLLFAKPGQPERRLISLAELLEEIYLQLRPDQRWGEGRTLEIQVPATLRVWFDPSHLRQVFFNLLLNAAQFTSANGQVVIRGGIVENRAEIQVLDNGVGIDPDLLPKVLEPFFTTRTTGTGLGLAMVGQLVRVNKGQISLANRPEGGLQVSLFLEGDDGNHPDL